MEPIVIHPGVIGYLRRLLGPEGSAEEEWTGRGIECIARASVSMSPLPPGMRLDALVWALADHIAQRFPGAIPEVPEGDTGRGYPLPPLAFDPADPRDVGRWGAFHFGKVKDHRLRAFLRGAPTDPLIAATRWESIFGGLTLPIPWGGAPSILFREPRGAIQRFGAEEGVPSLMPGYLSLIGPPGSLDTALVMCCAGGFAVCVVDGDTAVESLSYDWMIHPGIRAAEVWAFHYTGFPDMDLGAAGPRGLYGRIAAALAPDLVGFTDEPAGGGG